jgi:intracellular sulfur oxidation DsrE/DsrF family protein
MHTTIRPACDSLAIIYVSIDILRNTTMMSNNQIPRRSPLTIIITLFFVFFSTILQADDAEEVAALLAKDEVPDGVVFEIIGDGGRYLQHALEKVDAYQTQLREKFPDLEIAVVSHGVEQFAFKRSQAEAYAPSHSLAKQFVEQDIPVHVCETHAGWLGVTAEDFPDYIDVAPAGPTQIGQYEELGYELIVIE